MLTDSFTGRISHLSDEDQGTCEECGRSTVARFGGAFAVDECVSCVSDFNRLLAAQKIVVDGWEMKVVKSPVLDTGIGREAGYRDDAELVSVAEKQRAEADAMLTPEALERLEAAEREVDRRFLFGE